MVEFNNLHKSVLEKISELKSNLIVFSPYIKKEVVERILEVLPEGLSLCFVTRAKVSDFASQVSDLSALKLLCENKILVLINNEIHLKTYVYDLKSFHTGSANCTNKGLGFSLRSNYETLVYVSKLDSDYSNYLNIILGTSKILSSHDISILEMEVERLSEEKILLQEIELKNEIILKELFQMTGIFASQLPNSSSVLEMYEYLRTNKHSDKKQQFDHDIAIFNLHDVSLTSIENFKREVFLRILSHEVISRLFSSFDDSLNFGGVRRFYETNCLDNPRPDRSEINILINNLFNWLEELSGNDFQVIQPNHTKIIKKIKG